MARRPHDVFRQRAARPDADRSRQSVSDSPTGYGILSGRFGGGAVARRPDDAAGAGAVVHGHCRVGGVAILGDDDVAAACCTDLVALAATMLVAGAAWIVFISVMSALVQSLAPEWVRARVLAVFMLVFQGGLADRQRACRARWRSGWRSARAALGRPRHRRRPRSSDVWPGCRTRRRRESVESLADAGHRQGPSARRSTKGPCSSPSSTGSNRTVAEFLDGDSRVRGCAASGRRLGLGGLSRRGARRRLPRDVHSSAPGPSTCVSTSARRGLTASSRNACVARLAPSPPCVT